MIITDIKQQKNGRFAVYADGEYVLSISPQVLLQTNIAKGVQVTEEELEELVRAAKEQTANDRAFTILSYRDHSKEELRRKLARTVGEEQAEKTAQHMEDLGLVNDEEYAEKLAQELLERRLMGADRVLFEMTRRGIDRSISSEVIERLDRNPEERIRRFLERKYPRGLKEEKERRRATAALSRNGFRWEEIREVLRDYEDEISD